MIAYPIFSNFCKENLSSAMLSALKIEIKKGNTLMESKYLLFCSSIDLFDVKVV